MASHSYHGDLGAADTIFFDGCEECEARGNAGLEGLLTQTSDRVEVLWRRMLSQHGKGPVDDFPGDGDQRRAYTVTRGYLSDAEAKAGRQLYYVAVLAERAGDPNAWKQGRFYRG